MRAFILCGLAGLACLAVGDRTLGDPIPWYLVGAFSMGFGTARLFRRVGGA